MFLLCLQMLGLWYIWSMTETEILSTAQAAERLGISAERVRQLAAQGRFAGAFLLGKTWAIPSSAVASFKPNPHGVRLGRKPRKKPEGTGD